MDVFLYLVPVAIALFFLFRYVAARDKAYYEDLSQLWEKLNTETLEVSLLVSAKCPANSEAHELVITAAQCLVIPNSRFVTVPRRRYQEGFALCAKARALAEGNLPQS